MEKIIEKINASVEKHRELMLEAERYIWSHPETGYREYGTSKYMEDKFTELGYDLAKAGNIPGFYTVIDTGREGPEILVLGELDSLICPNHKEADKETGYVHACGHNVQCATLLGIAAALKEDGMLDGMCGKIMLCAVPAEELIEIGYRKNLIKEGKIKYCGGKSEFLHRGYFDNVDMAFMVHASGSFCGMNGAVGCMAKIVNYKGVSAHAGGSPWSGKNAIYAATQGLSAANAIRETFKESDIIRFHPIITHGGEAVNAIPELVTVEAFVRGVSFEAMTDANKRINQALIGSALSLGANIEIIDTPGYAPLKNDNKTLHLMKEAADLIIPEEHFVIYDSISSGSTDMGEMSCLMPVIHPYSGGVSGKSHGDDYYITDPERAVVKSAKMQITMLNLLLGNGAKNAKEIIEGYDAPFKSKEEYFDYVDKINSSGDRITYTESGAEIKL